jgi:hypothetical protein
MNDRNRIKDANARRRPWGLLAVLLALSTAFALSCGGSGNNGSTHWPKVQELTNSDITPIPIQHTLEVGDDRFSLAFQDKQNQLILHANVAFAFYKIDGEKGTLITTAPGAYAGFDTSSVEEMADGTQRTITGPEVGAYVAHLNFDQSGNWGVETSGDIAGKKFGPIRFRFDVLEKGVDHIPAIGDPAPRSKQLTLRDVKDISEIDTTNPPNPEMHNMTVAEALDTGKPIVVAFTTPAFCTSRTCGPVTDKVVVPLFKKYGDRAIFVHIEPYDLKKARDTGELVAVPATTEWGLQTEPWVFVVNKQGHIAGKFEGIMGVDEVESVLQQTLQ